MVSWGILSLSKRELKRCLTEVPERRPMNVFGPLRMDSDRKLVDMFVCFVGNGEVERRKFGLRACDELPRPYGRGSSCEDDAERMQRLVDGESVELEINDKLTYSDFKEHDPTDFWTLLLYSGYLTATSRIKNNSTIFGNAINVNRAPF